MCAKHLVMVLLIMSVAFSASAQTTSALETETEEEQPAKTQKNLQAPLSDKVREVEALYAEGAAIFSAGNYVKALEKFKQAYKIIPEPNLLYNIGRCYEAMGNIDEALTSYKKCMDHPDSQAEAKVRSAQRYEFLVKARVDAAKFAKPEESKSKETIIIREPLTQKESSSVLPFFRWLTLGIGVALTVAGSVTMAMGVSDHNQIENLEGYGEPEKLLDMTRVEAMDLKESGTKKKTIGGILLGTGLATLATSAVLFFIPDKERSTTPTVAFTLTEDEMTHVPAGIQFLLRGHF